MDERTVQELVERAIEAGKHAYAPYSRFPVGAAILTDDHQIITGCNVENCSYSLTICAERVAATTAIAADRKSWKAIAISSPGGVTPCGACRQFLSEFARELAIITVDIHTQRVKHYQLSALLPHAFDDSSLPEGR